jgi:hypothetical protein
MGREKQGPMLAGSWKAFRHWTDVCNADELFLSRPDQALTLPTVACLGQITALHTQAGRV